MYDSGGVGAEGSGWMRGLGLSFTNPVGTVGVLDVCLCLGCSGVGGVGAEWVGLGVWTKVWKGGWCYVCVRCESRIYVQIVGPGICILCLADTCAS